jgi:hypothetical protein
LFSRKKNPKLFAGNISNPTFALPIENLGQILWLNVSE